LTGKVYPKKKFGQHFLTEPGIAKKIALSITVPDPEVPILEVGPGTGMLTRQLLNECKRPLKAIEIDEDSVKFLDSAFPELKGNIIQGDFLSLPLDSYFGKPLIIAGNFPYNISTQILFRVFENPDMCLQVVGMFQREVARRIVSGPGNKEYGILSVLLRAWYDLEYLFTVSEGVFNPPPKVKTGVLRLNRNARKKMDCNPDLFKKIVKAGFNQRRKTLRNALSKINPQIFPEIKSHPFFSKRAEQLSFEEFTALTLLFENQGNLIPSQEEQ
jgi:16S rRNA (adenine1518-N6/adenine1519-N6)-dimethyltransferase